MSVFSSLGRVCCVVNFLGSNSVRLDPWYVIIALSLAWGVIEGFSHWVLLDLGSALELITISYL